MDNNPVNKIIIPNRESFYFSRKFHDDVNGLLIEATVLYRTVRDLPILPALASRLDEELIRRSIFSTAALEGNPLNEEEVGKIISQDDTSSFRERKNQEIVNLSTIYQSLKRVEPRDSRSVLSEDIIQNAHSVITGGIDYMNNIPGSYRNERVKVGDREHGGTYVPPETRKNISMLMGEFITFINSSEVYELNTFIRAGLAHYHLGLIHPFGDGNGRTARIIEALILANAGIRYVPPMLSNYYYRNIDDYYQAFSLARKHKQKEVTPFLEFVLKGVIESMEDIKSRITSIIRTMMFKEYISLERAQKHITQRQHDLLQIVLETGAAFSLHDLLNKPPYTALYRHVGERTARRDIEKLRRINLLLPQEKNTYSLNMNALG